MTDNFISITDIGSEGSARFYDVLCEPNNSTQRTTKVSINAKINATVDIIQDSSVLQITKLENITLSNNQQLPIIKPLYYESGTGIHEFNIDLTFVKRIPLPTNHISIDFLINDNVFIIDRVVEDWNNTVSVSTTGNTINFNRRDTSVTEPLIVKVVVFTKNNPNNVVIHLNISQEVI